MFGANAHYFVPQEVDSSIEKKQPTATVRPVPDFTDSEKGDHTEWTPGYLARFPWLGMGALFTVILCAIGSILTLVLSNGKSQTHWPEKLAPNVILGGLNNLANIMFGIAIGNGIAIAWWRKTLQGATIQELHRSWSFSSSFKDLMLAGKVRLTLDAVEKLLTRAVLQYHCSCGPYHKAHNYRLHAFAACDDNNHSHRQPSQCHRHRRLC